MNPNAFLADIQKMKKPEETPVRPPAMNPNAFLNDINKMKKPEEKPEPPKQAPAAPKMAPPAPKIAPKLPTKNTNQKPVPMNPTAFLKDIQKMRKDNDEKPN